MRTHSRLGLAPGAVEPTVAPSVGNPVGCTENEKTFYMRTHMRTHSIRENRVGEAAHGTDLFRRMHLQAADWRA